ncbi:MAG: hypothetical protein ABSC06_03535 [Rhodopila sp.]
MSLSLTLDVAISLVFVYVLAALLASTVNEMIAGVLKLRGVYLTKAIETLTSLGTGNSFKWGGLTGWAHAYFQQSSPEVSAPVDRAAMAALESARTEAAKNGASAASVAAEAMTEVATFGSLPNLTRTIQDAASAPGATVQSVLEVISRTADIANLQSHPLLVGTPTSLPSYVPAQDFAAALLGVLKDGSRGTAFQQARHTINTLPDGDLKKTLLAFISAGADDIDKLRKRIEGWFDDSMQRLSGIYTRFTQYVMLALGLLIAVTMNIDSVHLGKTLWEEPSLSRAISDSAARYVSENKNNPFGCTDNPPPSDDQACKNKIGLKAIVDVIDQQRLPIGRVGTDFFGCPSFPPGNACIADPVWKTWTCVGWVVTAFAISLGAQFWFGVLTQLTNIRAAGEEPQRADATNRGNVAS